jgi:hypothetical protein
MKREDNPIVRYQRESTRKNAIHAKCAECVGCTTVSIEQGFRESISTCTSKECSLYGFRPYRSKKLFVPPKRGQL